jgi:branched-chain amino acid transport system permease protein
MSPLFVQTLTLGLLQGGLYALSALGLALVFGVLRAVNFAHGELAMLGAYGAFFAIALTGAPLPVAIAAAGVAGGVAGYLMNRVVLAPIYNRRMANRDEFVVIGTFMLSQVLIAAATIGFGTTYRRIPGFWNENLRLFGMISLSGNRVAAFAAAMLIIAALFYVVRRTDLGRAWRALTQSPLGAASVGIDVRRYADYAFAVSGALAGTAAALIAPLSIVFPGIGAVVCVKAFVVVIIGGLGSIPGAFVAGLLLGLVEAFGSVYLSSSYTEAYGSLLMILVLLLRPAGLFGTVQRRV